MAEAKAQTQRQRGKLGSFDLVRLGGVKSLGPDGVNKMRSTRRDQRVSTRNANV